MEEEEFWQNDVIGKTFTSHEKEREAILINGFSSVSSSWILVILSKSMDSM